MRYSIQNYAKALAEVLAAAHGEDGSFIQKNFLELLRRSGDEAHLSKIVAEAERIMRAKDGTKRIVVHVARKQKQSARELVKHLVGPHDAVEEAIDPSLIAGMKVTMNDEMMFDGSLKTKLEAMFGNI
jgi:F0F1-type ATP synthase delta subunit